MHAEWAKTKAHTDRWEEEVTLLVEEMWWVLQYLEWKAKWWLLQWKCCTDARANVTRGLVSHAEKQLSLIMSLARSFAKCWYPILLKHNIPVAWLAQFIPVAQ